jgi:hypothetical protein
MFKTPYLGPVLAAMLLAGATVGLTAPISGGGAISRVHAKSSLVGLNAWDGRRLDTAGITTVGQGDLGAGVAGTAWDDNAAAPDHDSAESGRVPGDFGDAGASKLANLSPDAEADALPLSQVAGSHAKAAPGHGALGVWDFVNRVRYGRLPEPASWALMMIGFAMIGGALRGFVVANRRLARLQPEDGE